MTPLEKATRDLVSVVTEVLDLALMPKELQAKLAGGLRSG